MTLITDIGHDHVWLFENDILLPLKSALTSRRAKDAGPESAVLDTFVSGQRMAYIKSKHA